MRLGGAGFFWALLFLFLAGWEDVLGEADSAHIVFSTDCSIKFGWQSLALLHSLKRSGQPGAVTRLLSCTPEELAAVDQETLGLVQTYITPSFAEDPDTGDDYPPYNRPKAISLWLEEVQPKEEWIIVLDPDMLFRHPVTISNLRIPDGYASGSPYEFMTGCSGVLGERHIPEVPIMLDEFGGPSGRRCDYVGAMMITKTEDMVKIAPLWFDYSKRVRDDPLAWNSTDDPDSKPGEKIWVAEMYGYAFAAAKVGVRHILSYGVQNYPAYSVGDTATADIANLLHYTLEFSFLNYTFNKRDYEDFNYTKCPTEDYPPSHDHGVFPHPPYPSEIVGEETMTIYDQWLGIYTVNAMNEALCERHREKCQPTVALERTCGIVSNISIALSSEEERLYKSGALCTDIVPECKDFAREGKCDELFSLTSLLCRTSCGICTVIEDYSEPSRRSNHLRGVPTLADEKIVGHAWTLTPARFFFLSIIFVVVLLLIRSQHQKVAKSN